MSDDKKYYYLKLKDNYFNADNIRIIESIENGYIYSLIILKLYLKSCKYDGRLMMTERIPYDPNKLDTLSRVLNHDIAHVKEAIKLGCELDLITILDSGQIWMNEIQNFIGHSSTEADRKRKYRLRLAQKDICPDKKNNTSDKNPPEKEKELKKEIDKIYKTYPSRCLISDRSTGKSKKCKDKIKSILKGKKTDLLKIIKQYVRDCEKNKTYMKNFSTFLNNLPDYKDEYKKPEKRHYILCPACNYKIIGTISYCGKCGLDRTEFKDYKKKG